MPKFYTPTFSQPVTGIVSPTPVDAATAAINQFKRDTAHIPGITHSPVVDLAALRAEDEKRARRERLARELEAARAENARLLATRKLVTHSPAVPVPPYVDPTIDDSVTAFQKAQIDAMVALMVAEGVVSYDVETDQYVRPRSAVWCFNGPKPWTL